jgi:quercetin dioxygenase-like cupin family protein
MTIRKKWAGFALAVTCATAESHIVADQIIAEASKSKAAPRSYTVFSGALPHLDGNHLDAKIVEVTYGPGDASSPHSHPCPVIGYVLEGSVRIQVEGEPEAIYKPGESFYEAPNGIHQVSANASNQEPAKFLAYFLCDHDTPLSVPALGSKTEGGK